MNCTKSIDFHFYDMFVDDSHNETSFHEVDAVVRSIVWVGRETSGTNLVDSCHCGQGVPEETQSISDGFYKHDDLQLCNIKPRTN